MELHDSTAPQKPNYTGRLSFTIGVFSAGSLFLVFLVAALLGPGRLKEGSSLATVLGAFLLLDSCIALVGEGIGIAGLLQRDRSRAWPIIGMVLNGVVVVFFALAMLLGLAVKLVR